MTAYRAAAPAPTASVELGPIKRPDTIVILLALALVVVPIAIGAYGCFDIASRPDRVTLACSRRGEQVECSQIDWWRQGDGWKSQLAARHAARRDRIEFFEVRGKSPKQCVAFDTSSVCGGDARANAAAIQALQDGGRVELDATRSETFGLVMAYGSLTGLLFVPWLMLMAVLLGRRTRVRLVVHPSHLEVSRAWAGVFPGSARRIQRIRDETALVVLESRGGRGDLPTWQLAYQGPTTSTPLLSVKSIERPAELDQAAERTRAVLAQIPRLGP